MSRSRATRTPTATSTGSARSSGALAVGGLAFGAIRGQEREWTDSARLDRPRDRRRLPRPLPDPHGDPARTRSSRCRCSGTASSPSINLATFLIYGALYVSFTYTALLLPGDARLHARPERRSSASRRASSSSPLSARVGGADRPVRRADLPRRRAADRRRRPALAAPGSRRRSKPWLADARRPGDPRPAGRCPHRRPAGACIVVRDSASSMVVAPLTSTLMGSIPTRNSGLGRRSTTRCRGSASRSSAR